MYYVFTSTCAGACYTTTDEEEACKWADAFMEKNPSEDAWVTYGESGCNVLQLVATTEYLGIEPDIDIP